MSFKRDDERVFLAGAFANGGEEAVHVAKPERNVERRAAGSVSDEVTKAGEIRHADLAERSPGDESISPEEIVATRERYLSVQSCITPTFYGGPLRIVDIRACPQARLRP